MPPQTKRVMHRLGRLATDFPAESDALRRRAFWRLAAKFTPVVSVDRDGMRLFVSTSDDVIGRRLFVNHHIPEHDIAEAFAALRSIPGVAERLEGCRVVEVGANIGNSTVEMMTRYGVGSVVAIEPSPDNCRLLRQNLVANAVADRVTVLPLALSDHEGVAELEISPENSGDHRIRVADAPVSGGPEASRETIDVRTTTFDALIASGEIDLDDIGMVWMDAQGHEGHILAGATRLLGADLPIFMEYWPYNLQRTGGLDALHEAVAANYEYVIDLNTPGAEGRPRVVAAADIARLVADHGTSPADITDLILFPGIERDWRPAAG